MKKIILIKLLVAISFLISCIRENELWGVYSITNQKNTVDTLRILSDGTYERTLHKKNGNELIFRHTNKWFYGDGRITFDDYLLDNDNKYDMRTTNFEDVLITSTFPVEKKAGKIVIYCRQGSDYDYYEKVK